MDQWLGFEKRNDTMHLDLDMDSRQVMIRLPWTCFRQGLTVSMAAENHAACGSYRSFCGSRYWMI